MGAASSERCVLGLRRVVGSVCPLRTVARSHLEETTGAPLWNPAFGPMQILGRPVIINDQAPAPTAGLVPIVFADFKRFYVVRTGGVLSIPLVERFAEALLGALIVAEFCDGAIWDSKAGVALKMHA